MSSYLPTFMEFMNNRFGKTIGGRLFSIHQQKAGRNFSQMDEQEQYNFIRNMLHKIFAGFYSEDKINIICLQLFFQFSQENIQTRIERTLRHPVKVDDIHFNFSLYKGRDDLQAHFSNNHMMCIACSGAVDGGLLLSLDNDSAQYVTYHMMQANGMEANSAVEPDLVVIKEFYNIILPGVADMVANSFQKILYFTYDDEDEFRKKYMTFKDNSVIEKVDSSLSWKVGAKQIETKVSFLMLTDNKELNYLMRNIKRHEKESLYESPDSPIISSFKPDKRANLIDFLDDILDGQGTKVVDRINEKLNMHLADTDISVKDLTVFKDFLIESEFSNASDRKRLFLSKNIDVILGLNTE